MTFHIFFLTITIQKTRLSKEELEHEQCVQKIMDEVKDRQISFYNHL
ncbi:YrzI family small protein [Bacillus rhizoplanae]